MAKIGKNVVTVSTREAALKKRFRRHLKSLGFHKAEDGSLVPPGTGNSLSKQRNKHLQNRALSRNSTERLFYAAFLIC
jgi:hypothetical protein